jgi:hypothetical protein
MENNFAPGNKTYLAVWWINWFLTPTFQLYRGVN